MIYITGHKNPDTDSVVSAIAYANLKNKTGKENYFASVAGDINAETKFVLALAKQTEPKHMLDFSIKAKEIMTKKVICAYETDSLEKAVKLMESKNIRHLPIIKKNNEIIGIVSFENLADNVLKNIIQHKQSEKILKEELKQFCEKNFDFCFLLSPEKEVKEKILKSKYGSLIVITEDNKIKGIITKTNLLAKQKPQVILVDHNELSQAAEGIEDAEILEVVDHHRVSFTNLFPINFSIKPLGSTSTVIFERYSSERVTIDKKIATLLLGGIISDTLNLTSDTTTQQDKEAIKILEKIANQKKDAIWKTFEEITKKEAEKIMSYDANKIVHNDFKVFNDKNKIGLAQIGLDEKSREKLLKRKDELLSELERMKNEEKFDFVGLILTNVEEKNSIMLCKGNSNFLEKLPWLAKQKDFYELPGIVSRKKQIAPVLLQI